MPRISSFAAAAAASAGQATTATASHKAAEPRIEVVVAHALDGYEIHVQLPAHARFKHIKKAIARSMGNDAFLERGQLVRKDRGLYRAYKDTEPIGDVRRVLMARLDLDVGTTPPTEASLEDGEVSAGEEPVAASSSSSRPGASDSEGADAPGRVLRPAGARFTRSHAVGLQRELLEGFSTEAFQRQLAALEPLRVSDVMRFVQERQELMLTVQSVVLPRYGFEGNQDGVFKMMGEWGPFLKDPEFRQLAEAIHELLGIDLPPDMWERTTNTFKKATSEAEKAKVQPQAQSQLKAALRGSSGGLSAPGPRRMLPPPLLGKASARGSLANSNGEAVPVSAWPGPPPFKLFVAGSWTDFDPEPMKFDGGFFVHQVILGPNGCEWFQLLKDGSWDATIYPSCEDASPYDQEQAWRLCGPDGRGHNKNWLINKDGMEGGRPGGRYVIIVSLDSKGQVSVVHWQPF